MMRILNIERFIMNTFRKKIVKIERSTGVFPRNSFWTGVGSIFNVSGRYFEYNTSKSEIEADKKALLRDWDIVGTDIKSAEKYIKRENKELCIF